MAAVILVAASWLAGRLVRAQDAAAVQAPDAAVDGDHGIGPAVEDPRPDGGGMVQQPEEPMAQSPSFDGGVDGGAAPGDAKSAPTTAWPALPAQPDPGAGSPESAGVVVAARLPSSTALPTSHWGLGADLGLSGPFLDAGLLLGWRPVTWAGVQAGGGYNGFAFGVRAGATLINPFAVPLSFTCEAGHYFEGDANKVVRWFSNDVEEIASLRRFSYDYLNLLGGMEFGGQRFSIYVRGGVTWMRTTIKDFAQSVHDLSQVDLQASNPKVLYRGPTFKVGTRYFF